MIEWIDPPQEPGYRVAEGAIPQPPVDTTGVVDAAFRQDNTVVNLFARMRRETFTPEPDYNPLPEISGTKYFQNHADNFLASQSSAETQSIKRRIDQEDEDRKVLQAAGWGGTLAQLMAGAADPIMWLVPGGEIALGARGAANLGRQAVRTGAGFAVQAGVAETALQATQETRTFAESAAAVGTATLLGAILGPAFSRLGPADRVALETSLEADRKAMAAHANQAPATPERQAAGAPPLIPEAAGAAAADTRQLVPVTSGLDKVPVLGKVVDRLDPMSRLFRSESVTARRATADLAETPLRFEENLTGGATTTGPALSRLARMEIDSTRVAVGDTLDRLYAEYRFADPNISLPRLRDQFERATGNKADRYLSPSEFKTEVSKALQQRDQHDIPQVAQAAQFIRGRVFDPWHKRAIEAGLIADGLPKGAESYFHRVWNKEVVKARRPQFVERVTSYLKADQSTKAGIKSRLVGYSENLQETESQIKKFQAKLTRLEERGKELGGRLKERRSEVARAEKRADALEERAASITEEINELQLFLGEMRESVREPGLVARLDALEREVVALRQADRPVTEANLRAIENEELKSVLTPDVRTAAEILVGRRKPPKAPSFISGLIADGGIKDDAGEVAAILGGARRPGLINQRGRALDEIGMRLQEEFPEHFPDNGGPGGGAPTAREVLDWISEATRGREPSWWVDRFSDADRSLIDAAQYARALDEVFTRAGVEVKNVRDVAAVLRGEGGKVSLEDLDKIAADMEAAGQAIPVSGRRAAAESDLGDLRASIAKVRETIGNAIEARNARQERLRVAEARGGEAARVEAANRGRLGVLEDRLTRDEMRREILDEALAIASRQHDEVRSKIEAEIGSWEGGTAAEAKSAIKAREKYQAEREVKAKAAGAEPPAKRLVSADATIDRTVRRILASDRALPDSELLARADEITDRVIGSPDGRLPYEMSTGASQVGPGETARGPLAARRFAIPDHMIADFLETDVEAVVQSHLRAMVPDVLLTEKFGDPGMTSVFSRISDEFAARAAGAKNEAQAAKIGKERDATIRDLAAIRDRVRGVYGFSADAIMQGAARAVAIAKNVNLLTSGGSFALTSLSDLAGTTFRYGLGTVMGEAWAPFLRSLTKGGDEWKQAARQYRAMGIANEVALATRSHAISDITDLYRPQSRLERGLQWGADKYMVANLLAPWTDWGKINASIIAGNEILRASKAVAGGTATKRQIAQLAESGIPDWLASRIWNEFSSEGAGEIVNGTHLPNTERWKNTQARQAFEGAVGREADIAIITPGQEKPLWMSNPVLSVFGQFKSFMAASTQRLLIANLQRADAQALQGLIFSIGMGAISYRLNALAAGTPVSDRPQDWIKEGISRSGVLGWFEEGNAMASKMTRGGVDVYRLIGADKPLSRYASRSALDSILGPTAGKIGSVLQVSGAATTGDWTQSDSKALRRMIATQNLFYVRGLWDQVEKGINGALNVPEKRD